MFVSDRPEAMESAFGLVGPWQRAGDALTEFDLAVFGRLAPGAPAWILGSADGSPLSSACHDWHRVYLIDEAPASQFDALRELLSGASAKLPGPIAAIACSGRGFHGQRGRSWSSERGNLFLCAAIGHAFSIQDYALALTTLPAVVAVDGLRGAGVPSPRIKWVNDVLVDGHKVAGVLTATQSTAGVVESAVFGIGMNVASAPEVTPTPFVPSVGAVRQLVDPRRCSSGSAGGSGHPSSGDSSDASLVRTAELADMAGSVLASLARRVRSLVEEGPSPTLAEYLDATRWLVGRRVRIYPESWVDTAATTDWPAPEAHGVVTSIGTDLSLTLSGTREPVRRGRLALEEACLEFGLEPLD